jgi:hypothetical protein
MEKEYDAELLATQRERDAGFAVIVDRLKDIYHGKNLQYGDAYRQVNDDLDDAFQDVRRKMDLIEVSLKYRDRVFKPEKFISDVGDLVIYGIMFIDFVQDAVAASASRLKEE